MPPGLSPNLDLAAADDVMLEVVGAIWQVTPLSSILCLPNQPTHQIHKPVNVGSQMRIYCSSRGMTWNNVS
ncbi:hypothetical protein Hanom_Chr10g00897371 [Helianthus anomalus]